MSSPQIIYSARSDTPAETEASVLGTVYKFVLDHHAKKEAAPESRPDDAKGSKHDRAKTSIHE